MKKMHRSDRMKLIFADPLIVAFRRDNNLQDLLVHMKRHQQFLKNQNSCRPCKNQILTLLDCVLK